ncbi:MAG: TIGR00159 family protein [Verrucomicrobia bacterium]|nr:TIGR00159 family protein [Verrucomicrobiota bacterium]
MINLTTFFTFLSDNWTAGLEILILAILFYYAYLYLKKIHGASILIWVGLTFIALTFTAQIFDLAILNWLLKNVSAFIAMALVVIFQPELRRALNEFGIHRLFTSASQRREAIEDLTDLVFALSAKGFGALIALERDMSLATFAETGIKIDAVFSKELITTIFYPKTLLHDGGLIIGDGRIVATSCIFPLSQRDDLDRTLGLRHRAGLGLSEETDAIVLVISEETGNVSICHGGIIERNLNEEAFQKCLQQLMLRGEKESQNL